MSPKAKAILFSEYRHKIEVIETAKKQGYENILVTRDEDFLSCDLFDAVFYWDGSEENLEEIIHIFKEAYDVCAVISNYDYFVVDRAFWADKLGLPGCSIKSSLCTRNKVLLREALNGFSENIEYRIVSNFDEALKAMNDLGGEVFLKVITGIKGRCVYRVKTEKELKKSWESFQEALERLDSSVFEDFLCFNLDEEYPDPKKCFLIEKAYSGNQVAVSAFVGSDNIFNLPTVSDIYPARKIGIDDSFLAFRIIPSKFEQPIIERINDLLRRIVETLELKNCAVFIDLIITKEGDVKIVEVASRLGGYRSLMYQASFGCNLSEFLLEVAQNRSIDTENLKLKKYSSLLEIFPRKQGKFVGVKGLDELEKDSNVVDIKVNVVPGDKLGLAQEGFVPVMRFLLVGDTYDEVYQKSLGYQKKLLVEVD